MKKYFLTLFLCATSIMLFATDITSDITSNTTWTYANSPYNIKVDIQVDAGVTLTIDEKVTVYFDTGKALTVYGEIIADATHSNEILFSNSTGDTWDGIRLIGNGTDYSSFEFCIFEYAEKECGSCMISIENNGGALYINDYLNVDIYDCIFRDNFAARGGAIYCINPNISFTPHISRCQFNDNEACDNGGAIGIYGINSSEDLVPEITGSTFEWNSADNYGGAIWVYNDGADALIDGCHFSENTATYGGAIGLIQANMTIERSTTFQYNEATRKGGGIYLVNARDETNYSITINDQNTIHLNYAPDGAGIYVEGFDNENDDVLIEENLISSNTNNTAYPTPISGNGAGIYCRESTCKIYNNRISANLNVLKGGGIYAVSTGNSLPDIQGNMIDENYADRKGGGIYIGGDGYVDIINNTIIDNRIFPDDNVPNEAGPGVYIYSASPDFYNNIIYFNLPGRLDQINDLSSLGAYLYNCDIEGTVPSGATDCINLDPEITSGHLNSNSPCINTGLTTPGNLNITEDVYQGDRIVDDTIEIGAEEYDPTRGQKTTSILDDDNIQNEVLIFPNPVNKILTITSNSDQKEINIYNLIGKLVYSSKSSLEKVIVDFSTFPNSVYTVEVKDLKTNNTHLKKIVKY